MVVIDEIVGPRARRDSLVILFSGIGSLMSGRLFRTGVLDFRRTALLSAVVSIG